MRHDAACTARNIRNVTIVRITICASVAISAAVPGRYELEGQIWLRVLGPVKLWDGDAWLRPRGPQLRLLLGCLVLSAGPVKTESR